MRSSALSEDFWEIVRSFTDANMHLLNTFRTDLIMSRAALYAAAIHDKGAPLPACIGFIHCTKIRMSRPGGSTTLQRSVYSGHKCFHCLIYQTVTTPDALVFHMYGPEVGRRHDMNIGKAGWTLSCTQTSELRECNTVFMAILPTFSDLGSKLRFHE